MIHFPSLFFTVDKAHAHELSAVLRGSGIKVYPLTEDTPDGERKRFIRMFKEKAIDGLASCGVLTEGFDAPETVGGFMCRPTKSGLLYRQMAGRILRPWPPPPPGDRPYQKQALLAIWRDVQQSTMNQLVILPTGTGKTHVSAQMPRLINYWKKDAKRGRILFLVHREELCNQTADTFRANTNLSVGIEKAESYAGDADVVVGSVQTLGPAKVGTDEGEATFEYNRRLLSFNPDQFDCVIVDECLSGDAVVQTDRGPLRIDDSVFSYGKIKALSYNEPCGTWEYRTVTRWMPKGTRPTITIKTVRGDLTCTENHRLLTDSGWVEAGKIQLTHKIASPSLEDWHPSADADVGRSAVLRNASPLKGLDSLKFNGACTPSIKATVIAIPTCTSACPNSRLKPLSASADAAGGFPLRLVWSSPEDTQSNRFGRTGGEQSFCTGTAAERQRLTGLTSRQSHYPARRSGSFTELSSGIPLSPTLMPPADFPGFSSLTASNKGAGLTTNVPSSARWHSPRVKLPTPGTERHLTGGLLRATLDLFLFLTWSGHLRKRKSRGNGSIESPKKAWRGGIWTTGPYRAASDSTPRGTGDENRRSSSSGSRPGVIRRPGIAPRVNTGTYPSTPTPAVNGYQPCASMPPQVCSTNFAQVLSLKPGPSVPVFDLEVEENHNFVANGLLVHNCHHAVKGKYYHNVMRHLRVLKGFENRDPQTLLLCITATANRADNVGMEVVCDKITYEFGLKAAIDQGFLAPFHAYRAETSVDISKVKTHHGDYSSSDLSKTVNTPERNELVAREYLRIREMITPDFESNVGSKPYAVLTDFVDNTGKNRLIVASTLFGLREKFDPQGASVTEAADEMEKLQEENPGLDLQDAVNLEDARRRADAYKTDLRRLDLLAPAIPNELRGLSKMTWVAEGEGAYRLGLMDHSMLTVRQDALGGYEISRHVRGMRTLLGGANSLAAAVKRAEDEVSPSERRVLSVNANWRSEPPSEKQAGRLIIIDRHLHRTFEGSAKKLYEYCKGRYELGDQGFSKGGLTDRMNRIDAARR